MGYWGRAVDQLEPFLLDLLPPCRDLHLCCSGGSDQRASEGALMRLLQQPVEPLLFGGEPGGLACHRSAPVQLHAAMACSMAF